MAKRECPNCKNKLEDDDLFCQKCGTKVEKEDKGIKNNNSDRNMLTCPNCKQKTSKDNKFCDKCGSKIILKEEIKTEEAEKKENIHKCTKCNNPVKENDTFCMNCGSKLSKEEETKDKEKEKADNKSMLTCPNCKQKTSKDNKFCDKCGNKIILEEKEKKIEKVEKKEDIRKCPNCGNQVKENDTFCMSCGNKLSKEKEVKVEPTVIKKRKCNNCNEKLGENDIFCPKCGSRNDFIEDYNNLEQTNINNPNTKKKSSNFLILTTIFLLLIIIAMLLIILLTKGNDKEKEETNGNHDEKIVEKTKKEDKQITIYYDNGEYTTEETSTTKKVGTIKATDENVKIYDGITLYTPKWEMDGAIVLYKDNDKIKINNTNEDNSKTIDIKSTYDKYKIVKGKENSIIGIEYLDGVDITTDKYGDEAMNSFTKSGFYNIDNNKIMYEDEGYYDFSYVTKNRIMAKKGFNSDKKVYLLGTNENKVYLSNTQTGEYDCDSMSYEGLGDYFILEGETNCLDGSVGNGNVYSENINLIERNVSTNMLETYEDNLYIFKNNVIYKYNKDGRELYRSNEYEKVLDIIQDYFIIVENEKIKLKNEKDLDITIGNWKSTYIYHSMLSDYYDANELSNEQEKDAGIYLIVQTDENGYSSGVEYYINPNTHEIKKYELKEIGGYAKPVLYLYPEKETNVRITFEHKDNLTTTYPKFNNEWKVLAKSNGDLYDENGKYYYGLYWEENSNHKVDFSTGFYVEKENAIDFLEEKLSIIGLNDKEKNEFIMYWLPILEKNEKSLVYFELTEERNDYNKLIINPFPDSILRIAMHVKKVNKKTNIKEEKLTTFKRIGFTAVEWGGVVYN